MSFRFAMSVHCVCVGCGYPRGMPTGDLVTVGDRMLIAGAETRCPKCDDKRVAVRPRFTAEK